MELYQIKFSQIRSISIDDLKKRFWNHLNLFQEVFQSFGIAFSLKLAGLRQTGIQCSHFMKKGKECHCCLTCLQLQKEALSRFRREGVCVNCNSEVKQFMRDIK